MLTLSRTRAPSQHIRRKSCYSTSHSASQPDTLLQPSNDTELANHPVVLTRKSPRKTKMKTFYFCGRTQLKKSAPKLVRQHLKQRNLYAKSNAFITQPLDEATLVQHLVLNAGVKEAKEKEESTEKIQVTGGPHPPLLPHYNRLVSVKDNISSSQFPTTCASKMLDGYMSPYTATIVENLQLHGAAIVGKTNMDEFGMGSHSINSKFGSVRRTGRWEKYSAGGSSGGSAVAVATRQSLIALGTDTGGSVRLPAAYTGTVGFKPSYGRISRWGLVPYANSLDTVGILCALQLKKPFNLDTKNLTTIFPQKAIDLDPTALTPSSRQRLKELVYEHAHNVPGVPALKAKLQSEGRWYVHLLPRNFIPLRIGVPMEYNTEEVSPSVRLVWQKLLENLQAQGHQIVPISLPFTKYALSAYYIIAAAEAASNLAKYDGVRYGHRSKTSDGQNSVLYANTRGEGFGREVRRRILLGNFTLSSEAIDNHFIQAQKIRRLVQRDFDRVFALPNGLRDPEPVDLSDLDENIPLKDKTGPDQVDLIICPTAPTTAPKISDIDDQSAIETYMNDVFTAPASLAGLPAISIPVDFGIDSKAGMQVIGQFYDDYFVSIVAGRIVTAMKDGDFSTLKPTRRKNIF